MREALCCHWTSLLVEMNSDSESFFLQAKLRSFVIAIVVVLEQRLEVCWQQPLLWLISTFDGLFKSIFPHGNKLLEPVELLSALLFSSHFHGKQSS